MMAALERPLNRSVDIEDIFNVRGRYFLDTIFQRKLGYISQFCNYLPFVSRSDLLILISRTIYVCFVVVTVLGFSSCLWFIRRLSPVISVEGNLVFGQFICSSVDRSLSTFWVVLSELYCSCAT